MGTQSDQERMEQLVADHSERGYHFACKLCGSAEEAKELVQEAFYRVFRSWDSFDTSQDAGSWFLTILKNVYLDSAKREKRRHGMDLDCVLHPDHEDSCTLADSLPDREEAVLERLARESELEAVRRALAGLHSDHRAVLNLFDVEGLGYEQIAEVLDCPVGTVRSRLNRARAALKKAVLEAA